MNTDILRIITNIQLDHRYSLDAIVRTGNLRALLWHMKYSDVDKVTIESDAFCIGDKMTALEHIAKSGNLQFVKWWVKNIFHYPAFAMDQAADSGNMEMLQFLHAFTKESHTNAVMINASKRNDIPMMEWIFNTLDIDKNCFAMAECARNGHLEACKWLKDRGFNQYGVYISACSSQNHDLIEWSEVGECKIQDTLPVARYGNAKTMEAVLQLYDWNLQRELLFELARNACEICDIEVLKVILEYPSNMNWQSIPLLAMASSRCDSSFVEYLEKKGICNASDAITRASYHGNLGLIQYLYSRGLAILVKDLCKSAERGHVRTFKWLFKRVLLTEFDSIFTSIGIGGNIQIAKFMLRHNSNLSCVSRMIEQASTKGHIEMVKWLIERFPRVKHSGAREAIRHGHISLLEFFTSKGVLTQSQDTLLIEIIEKDNVEILKFLMALLPDMKCHIQKYMFWATRRRSSRVSLKIVAYLHTQFNEPIPGLIEEYPKTLNLLQWISYFTNQKVPQYYMGLTLPNVEKTRWRYLISNLL